MRAIISDAADLGRAVRRVRESHGMTQRQLADALGTSQRYIHELEAGKPKRADADYFGLLSRLGITLTAEAPDRHGQDG